MTTTYATLPVETVQHFLDNIGGRMFTVTFFTKDGRLREITGTLDPKNKRSVAVPMMDLDSGMWKSFRVDSVLSLTK
jgi:hypothetical protein